MGLFGQGSYLDRSERGEGCSGEAVKPLVRGHCQTKVSVHHQGLPRQARGPPFRQQRPGGQSRKRVNHDKVKTRCVKQWGFVLDWYVVVLSLTLQHLGRARGS